jgi:hypothetical protein
MIILQYKMIGGIIMADNYSVHISHCCKWHGCKYGDPDCPVMLGKVEQEYLCEYCYEYLENEDYYHQVVREIDEMKQFRNRR